VGVAHADGSVHLVTGQGNRRTAIRIDPRWLEVTQQRDDFSQGLDGWHVWKPFGPASGYWRDRTQGAKLVVHPDKPAARVLRICKADNETPDCAIWNFPAGVKGTLTLRLRLSDTFAGATISLADRFYDPDDERGLSQAVFTLPIQRTMLAIGAWHKLELSWDLDQGKCHFKLNDQPSGDMPLTSATRNGISYLRLSSTAKQLDTAGMLIESVEVKVSPDPL
jgi:hypothetical protein